MEFVSLHHADYPCIRDSAECSLQQANLWFAGLFVGIFSDSGNTLVN